MPEARKKNEHQKSFRYGNFPPYKQEKSHGREPEKLRRCGFLRQDVGPKKNNYGNDFLEGCDKEEEGEGQIFLYNAKTPLEWKKKILFSLTRHCPDEGEGAITSPNHHTRLVSHMGEANF